MEIQHAINVSLGGNAIKLSVCDQMAELANSELNEQELSMRNLIRKESKALLNFLLETRQRDHNFQIRPSGAFESFHFKKDEENPFEVCFGFMFGDACVKTVPDFSRSGHVKTDKKTVSNVLSKFLKVNEGLISAKAHRKIVKSVSKVVGALSTHKLYLCYYDRSFSLWIVPSQDQEQFGFSLLISRGVSMLNEREIKRV